MWEHSTWGQGCSRVVEVHTWARQTGCPSGQTQGTVGVEAQSGGPGELCLWSQGPGGRCPLVCAAEEFLPDRAGSKEPALLLPFILKYIPHVSTSECLYTHAHIYT